MIGRRYIGGRISNLRLNNILTEQCLRANFYHLEFIYILGYVPRMQYANIFHSNEDCFLKFCNIQKLPTYPLHSPTATVLQFALLRTSIFLSLCQRCAARLFPQSWLLKWCRERGTICCLRRETTFSVLSRRRDRQRPDFIEVLSALLLGEAKILGGVSEIALPGFRL